MARKRAVFTILHGRYFGKARKRAEFSRYYRGLILGKCENLTRFPDNTEVLFWRTSAPFFDDTIEAMFCRKRTARFHDTVWASFLKKRASAPRFLDSVGQLQPGDFEPLFRICGTTEDMSKKHPIV